MPDAIGILENVEIATARS
ncbi:hypothetical protein [Streptomyces sp. NPDC060031]